MFWMNSQLLVSSFQVNCFQEWSAAFRIGLPEIIKRANNFFPRRQLDPDLTSVHHTTHHESC